MDGLILLLVHKNQINSMKRGKNSYAQVHHLNKSLDRDLGIKLIFITRLKD